MTVTDTIDKARHELLDGRNKQAAVLLSEAAYQTHDPQLEDQIRDLAEQGLASAGLFGKGRWKEIIRIAELRGARQQG
jgi:PHD/YefM family antitoxin component YafN of YafNO toxin-antitoxin module